MASDILSNILSNISTITYANAHIPQYFETHPDNDRGTAMTFAIEKFWIADVQTGMVYAYDIDGTYHHTLGFKLADSNDKPLGLTYANEKFWVLNYDWRDLSAGMVFAYDRSGTRIPEYDFGFGLDSDMINDFSPTEIIYVDEKFWIVDQHKNKIYAYNLDGLRIPEYDYSLHLGPIFKNNTPNGIAFADEKFWILDWGGKAVFAYLRDGTHADGFGFDVDHSGSHPTEMTHAAGKLWIYSWDHDTITSYDIPTIPHEPRPASITGTISADGTGLAGVDVILQATDGNIISMKTTDSSGSYTFDDVEPGSMGVSIVSPAGFVATPGTHTNYAIFLLAEQTIIINFTLVESSTPRTFDAIISGSVFSDDDMDGMRSMDEAYILTKVFIKETDITSYTDAGVYFLRGVPPGLHTIAINIPEGYTGDSETMIFVEDGATHHLDFALLPTSIIFGSISGTIYHDANSNGAKDDAEGISGVVVSVSDSLSGITDDEGSYIIRMVPAGEYEIMLDIPTKYANPDTKKIRISHGEHFTADYILVPNDISSNVIIPHTISGTVFSDENWNGIMDAGENGIAEYDKMILIQDVNGKQTLTDVITDDNGNYAFEIAPTFPALVQTHYFPQGHVVYDANTSWYTRISNPINNNTTEFDVGFHQISGDEFAELELRFFIDENVNGVRDAGEPPFYELPRDVLTFYIYTYTIGPVAYPIPDSNGVVIISDLVPADFAVLVDIDNLAKLGYIWASTHYTRDDDYSEKQYLASYPVSDDPEPGSRHIMNIGLVPK